MKLKARLPPPSSATPSGIERGSSNPPDPKPREKLVLRLKRPPHLRLPPPVRIDSHSAGQNGKHAYGGESKRVTPRPEAGTGTTGTPASDLKSQKRAREKDDGPYPKRRNVSFETSVVIEDEQEDERQAGPSVGPQGKGKAPAVEEDGSERAEVTKASA